jgi:L-lactate dehydrogenase complex protein LldG
MTAARDEILARVRRSLADVSAGDVPVARDYRRAGTLSPAATLDLFAQRCADYRANVRRVSAEDLPKAICDALAERGARRLAIPADLPTDWRVQPAPPADLGPSDSGVAAAGAGPARTVDWIEDHGLSHAELATVDGVVTGCAAAIAINGTIVLDGGAVQGRRVLTLLPDYHLCVVLAEQVVELVPEGIARLAPAAREGRPMTMIAGPSATSDIELERVEGVHGPRTLDVLVVGKPVV